ncbi:MAG: electron transport complex subunit RsxC [Spirochaetales bacterium]|nr:electron transport complex subunit RsxC [Spirochaetales bacterium]
MKQLKTFPKGGVHPADHKALAADQAIRRADPPSVYVIPMAQHLGKPADCTVSSGDQVTEGMVLGSSSGFISAPVHSPVNGTVKEIVTLQLPNGQKTQALILEALESQEEPPVYTPSEDWKNLDKQALLERIASMGVVGLGGATFPAHVKFTVPKGSKVDYFIVNGVECEPYLTADYRLMLEETPGILQGIDVVRSLLQPEHIVIGIENNKPEALRVMRDAVEALDFPVEVVPLKLKYPQGDEKQLIKAVTGREVPSGGLPIAVGAVVSNVATLYGVYEAVVLGKPLTERLVTVTGQGIQKPANLKVKIGTSVAELIEQCGGFVKKPVKIVSGGPMMGFSLSDLNTPVTKGTGGILVLTEEEVDRKNTTACLQCGRCVQVCPMGLHPTRLYKWIDHLDYEAAAAEGLMDCKECGSCAYSCPARIPLVQGMKLGKLMIRKKKAN